MWAPALYKKSRKLGNYTTLVALQNEAPSIIYFNTTPNLSCDISKYLPPAMNLYPTYFDITENCTPSYIPNSLNHTHPSYNYLYEDSFIYTIQIDITENEFNELNIAYADYIFPSTEERNRLIPKRLILTTHGYDVLINGFIVTYVNHPVLGLPVLGLTLEHSSDSFNQTFQVYRLTIKTQYIEQYPNSYI